MKQSQSLTISNRKMTILDYNLNIKGNRMSLENFDNNWRHNKLQRHQEQGNRSIKDNFQIERKKVSSIFWREFIQNALDARQIDSSGKKDVSLNINMTNISTLILRQYTGDNLKRLKAAGHTSILFDDYSKLDKELLCLIIEENGTTGLTGVTDDSFIRGIDQQWNSFWTGEAEEIKSSKSLGRRGQGKVTLFNASNFSTVFAYTNQNKGLENLLFGKCMFMRNYKHSDGHTYERASYFCGVKKINKDEQMIPIDDNTIIDKFKKDFNIKRTDKPGTSWVIPFVDKNTFDKQNILNAIISEFYIAIAKGNLSFYLDGERFDKANLVKKIDNYHIFKNNEYEKWVLSSIPANPNETIVEEDWYDGVTKPAKDHTLKDFNKLKDKFIDGETVTLNVPIFCKKKYEKQEKCFVKIFIKLNKSTSIKHAKYVRECLIIDKEEGEALKIPGKFFGLMLCDDELLSEYLGDAEDASHMIWNQSKDTLSKKYDDPQRPLNHVRRSLQAFLRLFLGMNDEKIYDLFDDILSIPVKKTDKPKTPSRRKHTPKIPRTKSTPTFEVNQIGSKITLMPGPGASKISIGKDVKILFAYSGFGEDASVFKNYHRYDFDLKDTDFKISTLNCSVINQDLNQLNINFLSHDFEIVIDGFDDISVSIKEMI